MRTLAGSSILTYHYTMPPVSNPENWNWTTFSFAPMVGFAMHNAPYRITVQWRYGVYMKGQRGPFQTSITIHVQNLVVTSPDVGKVLRWDPEKGITDTSFSYKIECAQEKQVSVRVRIYDMNRNVVYEVTEQKLCPGGYSFPWDGTMNTGYYGYPPEEGSNIAPSGLYTFDVEVEANPYDKDAVRSKALRVVSGSVDYLGYDDGGTPEDESDDNHLYYLRWYALYSGRDASWGEIWLYDPDLVKVQGWGVPMLVCVVHGWNDGLGANPNGEVHGVIISVPVSLMEKAGTYRFVLHFYDDYTDSYRNHQVKAASEVNALAEPLRFEVSTDPSGDSQEGHPGHQIGKKEKTKFYVVIKATLNWRGELGKTIAFMLKRTKTGEVKRKTGYLVTDPNLHPSHYKAHTNAGNTGGCHRSHPLASLHRRNPNSQQVLKPPSKPCFSRHPYHMGLLQLPHQRCINLQGQGCSLPLADIRNNLCSPSHPMRNCNHQDITSALSPRKPHSHSNRKSSPH